MLNFYAFMTAGLFCVWQPVMALSCDSGMLAAAGVTATGATVTHLQAGQIVDISNPASGCPGSFTTLSDICRITFNVATSNRSGIYMEIWMPDNWEGRYISTGNFGLNGCVKYDDLAYLSSLGLAVGGADGGHPGTSGQNFANNIEVVKDYSFRSVHTMTVKAKQVVKTYYNFTPKKNYYYGCSTGGRQGLQSAQMFPDDFDGIIAGSAAADFNNLAGWSGSFFPITGTSSSTKFVTSAQWANVHFKVMEKCDGIDGVNDTIIEDPDLCDSDPTTLSLNCGEGGGGADPSLCLSSTQIQTVVKAFGALRGNDETLLYPEMQPGVENDAAGFYLNGKANDIPTQWYNFAIFNGKGYDPSKLSVSEIVQGDQLDLGSISTWSGDLSAFQNRGSKLITTHGLADSVITSTNSARYYKHVSATMKQPPKTLDDFYRYFRISGMGHCDHGVGAWEIGQTTSTVPNTTQQNVLFALFNWVENGVAPDTLLGTKFVGDNSGAGVAFQRNHCRYPFRTTFVAGDPTRPENWNCTAIVDPSQVMAEET